MLRQHTYVEAQSVLDIIQPMHSILTDFIVLNMSVGVLRV